MKIGHTGYPYPGVHHRPTFPGSFYTRPPLSFATGDEWQRTLGTKLHYRRIDLIHDIRHIYTRLKTDGLKSVSRGFSGCGQADKICRYKKLRRDCLFQATNNEKPLLLKKWEIMGGSYHCSFFYDAAATVASPQTSFGVRLSRIHFSPVSDVGEK